MENDIARLKEEVEELRKMVLEIQQSLKVVPEPSEESLAKEEELWKEKMDLARQMRELLQGETLTLIFNPGGFCVENGRIWLHEAGYSSFSAFKGNSTVFFIPKDKVGENRNCPEELIEKYFSIFSNRQRISLMRALVNGEFKTSTALREETGLTEGQFYHHIGELFAADCIMRKGQDQYQISDTGKILLLIVEAIASELGVSTPLKPSEIEPLRDISDKEGGKR